MKFKHKTSQYLAEFFGTFFLIFFGCGSIILSELNSSVNASFVPLVFGGAVSIMIYAVGHISGAHFNPAVTVAFAVVKRFSWKRVPGHIISQIFGAMSASFIHKIIWGTTHSFGAVALKIAFSNAFLIEVILSFCLMFVIISVATDARAVGELAGIAIGLTVSLCAFVGGPMTSASINPARFLGPAIISGNYPSFLLYILAPILGTILGAKSYEWVRCYQEEENKNGDFS